MKINAASIPLEGLTLEEILTPQELDLDTEIVKIRSPINLKADIYKITNTVNLDIALAMAMHLVCGRCLNEFEIPLEKKLKMNYNIDKSSAVIDLNPDIREGIILEYPIKPLCKPDCKGLCIKCGVNLNEDKCNC